MSPFKEARESSAVALGKCMLLIAVCNVSFLAGCSETRTLNFDALVGSDRIDVRDLTASPERQVKQISDPGQIAVAVEFIQKHPKGWSEPFGGPPIPFLMLSFYKRNQPVGGFGFDPERIIVDPVRFGWWSLSIPAQERDDFLRKLDLQLPKR